MLFTTALLKMMDQFIKAQGRRDLDPALMDIPTFSGEKPEVFGMGDKNKERLQTVGTFIPTRTDK